MWGHNLVGQVDNPVFIEGLKLMAQADLTLDTGNPRPNLIAALVKVKDKVPGLRIVLDHTANLVPRPPVPNGRGQISSEERPAMEANLRELVKRPQVYFKLSEVMQVGTDGTPVTDPAVYKPRLDYISVRHLRRGPGGLRQRLAQWKCGGPPGSHRKGRARLLQREEPLGSGEVFLEEFHSGVQMGQAGAQPATALWCLIARG